MRKLKFVSLFVLLALLVSVVPGAVVAQELPPGDSGEAAIRERVTQALEARWNLLVDPGTPLEDFYHQDAQYLAARERERFERHYLQPVQRVGIKYTSVELQVEFKSIKVEETTAQVEVIVDVAYMSEYPNDPRPIMTREAGLEHVISLIYQDNQWYIMADQYFDMYSKQGGRSPGVPLLNDDEVPSASPEDETPAGVVPLWYHYYNRAGAVAYADTWWNSHNPKYRYFPVNDCTNYVSQCFDDRGQALMAWRSPFVWWYDFHGTSDVGDDTYETSWAVPHDQAYNLSRNTDVDEMRGSYVVAEVTKGLHAQGAAC